MVTGIEGDVARIERSIVLDDSFDELGLAGQEPTNLDAAREVRAKLFVGVLVEWIGGHQEQRVAALLPASSDRQDLSSMGHMLWDQREDGLMDRRAHRIDRADAEVATQRGNEAIFREDLVFDQLAFEGPVRLFGVDETSLQLGWVDEAELHQETAEWMGLHGRERSRRAAGADRARCALGSEPLERAAKLHASFDHAPRVSRRASTREWSRRARVRMIRVIRAERGPKWLIRISRMKCRSFPRSSRSLRCAMAFYCPVLRRLSRSEDPLRSPRWRP